MKASSFTAAVIAALKPDDPLPGALAVMYWMPAHARRHDSRDMWMLAAT